MMVENKKCDETFFERPEFLYKGDQVPKDYSVKCTALLASI